MKQNKVVKVLLSTTLVSAMGMGSVLALTGCNSDNTNNEITIEEDIGFPENTFGYETVGYLSSNEKYNFENSYLGQLNFKAEDNSAYVTMFDMSSFMDNLADGIDSTGETKENLNEYREEIYNKTIEQYNSTGDYQIREFTSDNGVSGNILVKIKNNEEDLNKLEGAKDITTENSKFFYFITKDLKMISVYSNEEIATNLFKTYSLDGDPTIIITEEMINNSNENNNDLNVNKETEISTLEIEENSNTN